MIIPHTFDASPIWAWKFKELLLQELQSLPDEFTLSFSGGIDSSMILYSLMEINKPPTQLLTFQIEDSETDDLRFSKKIARELNLPLTISKVPRVTLNELSDIVVDIKNITKTHHKITTQCCHGFHYMLKDIQTPHLVLGMYEDIIYETNAKVSIKFQEFRKGICNKEELDEYYNTFSTACYNNKTISNQPSNHYYIDEYIKHHGIQTHFPLKNKEIYDLFQSVGYMENNFVPYKDGHTLKKKWFVTDLLFKDWFDRFGNNKNNSNMHTKKKGITLNSLHTDIFNCNGNQVTGKYFKL